MWRELESEAGGANIFVNCGCLLFADSTDPRKSFVDKAEANLRQHKLHFEKLEDSEALRSRFPQIRFRDEDVGILDTGGVRGMYPLGVLGTN